MGLLASLSARLQKRLIIMLQNNLKMVFHNTRFSFGFVGIWRKKPSSACFVRITNIFLLCDKQPKKRHSHSTGHTRAHLVVAVRLIPSNDVRWKKWHYRRRLPAANSRAESRNALGKQPSSRGSVSWTSQKTTQLDRRVSCFFSVQMNCPVHGGFFICHAEDTLFLQAKGRPSRLINKSPGGLFSARITFARRGAMQTDWFLKHSAGRFGILSWSARIRVRF